MRALRGTFFTHKSASESSGSRSPVSRGRGSALSVGGVYESDLLVQDGSTRSTGSEMLYVESPLHVRAEEAVEKDVTDRTSTVSPLRASIISPYSAVSTLQTVSRTASVSNAGTPAQRWRDAYVMKFSGWAPTKPDAGLPPSLTPGARATSSAQEVPQTVLQMPGYMTGQGLQRIYVPPTLAPKNLPVNPPVNQPVTAPVSTIGRSGEWGLRGSGLDSEPDISTAEEEE